MLASVDIVLDLLTRFCFAEKLGVGYAVHAFRGLLNTSSASADILKGLQKCIEKIDTMGLRILTQVSIEAHRQLIADIASSSQDFQIVLTSYTGEILATRMNEIVAQIQTKNIELNLVNMLTSSVPGTSSMLDVFCERISKFKLTETGSSEQKLLFDLYIFINLKIKECYTLQQLCIEKRDECLGSRSTNDLAYIENKKKFATEELNRVFQATYMKFEYPEGCIYRSTKCKKVEEGNGTGCLYTGRVATSRSGCVVTGVRFRKRRGIVYIQIQTGKLLPLGLIDPTTVEWEPLPDSEEYEIFQNVITSYGKFNEDDIVVTGVQVVKCKPTYMKKGFLWFADTSKTINAKCASLKMIGRKINFREGTLSSDEVTKTLVSDGDEVGIFESKKDTEVIQEDKLIKLIENMTHSGGLALEDPPDFFWNNRFDEDDVTLDAPVYAINLLSDSFYGGSFSFENDFFCFKLYLKSLDYGSFLTS